MSASFDGTVAITGMNATDNPAPGVGVARAIRLDPSFRGRLVGLGYDALDPGFYADGLLDGGALLPLPSAGRETFLARIAALRDAFGLDALIPTLDSELRAVGALAGELAALGIGTFVPTPEQVERVSKPHLPALAEAAEIRVPASEAITTADGVPRALQRLGLPAMVKGPYYGAWYCESEAAALAAFHHFAATWGVPVIVQEHVAGEEYNVCALGDGRGGTVGAVAMRKLMLTDKGKGWAGVTVAHPGLLALTERIIAAVAWRGPLEVEVMVRGRGESHDDLQVLEINPRFPAWAYLTAAAGQNLPAWCARLALGLPVPESPPPYAAGRMFVRIALDQVADVETFGRLSATGSFLPPLPGAVP